MEIKYYLESINRFGQKEIIAIHKESKESIFGKIIYSEAVPSDVGLGWSKVKKQISEEFINKKKNKKKYDFTLEPRDSNGNIIC